ncbi:MAG: hypothetical protein IT357_03645 [Gemmatimonadaceae bacterium]|nr:hypothetical protein [Gemmatimonadaceae bacterium]
MQLLRRCLALSAVALGACSGDGPTPPPATAACDGSTIDVRTLALGDGVTITGADVACVALAGAGAEYVVMPQLTGSSLPYGGYSFRLGDPAMMEASASAIMAIAPQVDAREMFGAGLAEDNAQATLHGRMRAHESAAPRGAWRSGAKSRGVTDARTAHAIGDPDSVRAFSVLNTLAATPSFSTIGAALAYAGDNVLLYVDTLAGTAFTAPELAAMGALYDDALVPAMYAQFGTGSDIDGNGRVLFVLSPTVNAMVPASQCAVTGYVRGFFYSHDLTSQAATSNQGEVFYAFVPDPTGRWSCAHTKADVDANLAPTFMHELQHMISFGEHAIERNGVSEEPWLNEGLSHIAEELGAKLFEARYPAPSGRTNPTQIFPDSASPYITPNLLYSYRYLLTSTFYSLTTCAPGTFCSLAERGGSWLLLRFIADQQGDAVLKRLVESPLSGRANLEAVTGRSTAAWLGDFALAVNADSMEGRPRDLAPPDLRFSSRNLRKLYRALFEAYGIGGGVGRPFPIEPLPLAPGAAVTGSMRPGSYAAYRLRTTSDTPVALVRFVGADGAPFSQESGAQLAVLRLR